MGCSVVMRKMVSCVRVFWEAGHCGYINFSVSSLLVCLVSVYVFTVFRLILLFAFYSFIISALIYCFIVSFN